MLFAHCLVAISARSVRERATLRPTTPPSMVLLRRPVKGSATRAWGLMRVGLRLGVAGVAEDSHRDHMDACGSAAAAVDVRLV